MRSEMLFCITGTFLKQPEDTFVKESETAVFTCQVSNSSYAIHWIVNGVAADFNTNIERGVSVVHHTSTLSQLSIAGLMINNNTIVQCAGRIFEKHLVVEYILSSEAKLIIQSKCRWLPIMLF